MAVPKNRLDGFYKAGVAWLGSYPLHEHEFGEVFWVDGGKGFHTVNGQRISIQEGDFVFIRPWDRHRLDAPKKRSFHINNVAFRWDTFQHIKMRYFPDDNSVYGELENLPKSIVLTDRQLQIMRESFLVLFNAENCLLEIERFLINAFAELSPLRSPGQQRTHEPLPDWLERARTAIQDPEKLRIGLSEFYRLCSHSPEYVSRQHRRFTGETPGDYLRDLRMQRAATLLTGTNQEIIDIALDCGFESLSHFYSCFRKVYAVSPRRYRAQKQISMY